MNTNEIVAKVVAALEQCSIHYMLVGSFSSNIYGVERSTVDADMVIQLGSHSVSDLVKALGPDFTFDSQMGFETVTMTTRFIAAHLDPYFKIELFLLSDDPHDLERFSRRVAATVSGRRLYFPRPEDVIITKLRWSKGGRRQKDIDDVRNVLAVQQGRLDMPYIRQWCGRHQTLDILERILQSIPVIPEDL